MTKGRSFRAAFLHPQPVHQPQNQPNRNRHSYRHAQRSKRCGACRRGANAKHGCVASHHSLINHELGVRPVNEGMNILPCTNARPGLVPLALQQHPNYLRAVQLMGGAAQAFVIRDAADQIARVQVLQRRFGPIAVNWIARGPVWDTQIVDAQKHQALRALCNALPRAAITLAAPDSTADAAAFRPQHFRPLMTPQYMAELDLTQPTEVRLASQHGKWRNRLRHAQTEGVTVSDRPFRHGKDHHLLALEEGQRRTKRYRALPHSFVHHWVRANPHCTQVFLAHGPQGFQAYLLVLLHRPTATYLIGWTGAEGRRSSAHALLLWTASNWLADRGYLRFDLGLVDTENAPGLARFKIGSGAAIHPLGPTMMRLGLPRRERRKYPAA